MSDTLTDAVERLRQDVAADGRPYVGWEARLQEMMDEVLRDRARLVAEVQETENMVRNMAQVVQIKAAEIAYLIGANRKLGEALMKYGKHPQHCVEFTADNRNSVVGCICGYDAALKLVEEGK